MGHTNSTTNYHLPQFVTTDKPAWLTDINGAFSDIDTAINTAQTDATTAGNNATQALSDASDAASAASAADAKGAGALASIADTFDPTATYQVGDIVIHNSLLYTCTVAVTTPGAWTGTTNWTRTTVEDIIPYTASDLPLSSAPGSGSTYDAINDLTDSSAPLFKIIAFENSSAITIPSNGVVSLSGNDLNVSTPTGYEPVAVIALFANNNDVFYRSWNARAVGTQSFAVAHNVGATANVIFNCTILYAKTGYIRIY